MSKRELAFTTATILLLTSLGEKSPLAVLSGLAGLGFWYWLVRRKLKKDKQNEQPKSEDMASQTDMAEAGFSTAPQVNWRQPISRVLRAIFVLYMVFFITRWVAPGLLLDWPGQNTLLYQQLEEAQADDNYAEVIRLIRERLGQNVSRKERERLQDMEVQTLIEWAIALKDAGKPEEAYPKFEEAQELAQKYEQEAQQEALENLLAPTPTRQPTFTPLPTSTPQPTFTPAPTYTAQPTLPAGFNDCIGATLVEQIEPIAGELLQLYSCDEEGLYKVVWLIAATTGREAKQYSSLVHEGDLNGATFVPGGRSSFTVVVIDGKMEIKHYK